MKQNEHQVLFSAEEQLLFALVTEGIGGKPATLPESIDYEKLRSLAEAHAVYSFLQPALERLDEESAAYEVCQQVSVSIVRNCYRMLFLTRFVSELLEQEGVSNAVLKGVSTAALYPVPELRKTGDVDLMLYGEYSREQIIALMEKAGFTLSEEQNVTYHLGFLSPGNVEIELHTSFAEPFDLPAVNTVSEQVRKTLKEHVAMNHEFGFPLKGLDLPYHAFQLLVHMLHHFLRSGFGLKLLCDWVVIWRQPWSEEDVKTLQKLLQDSGLTAFTRAITGVCRAHLGLEEENIPEMLRSEEDYDAFLREILDAEEFGSADSTRMVVMKKTGFWGYVSEFHHQMHINYPKAGKIFLLWPFLWTATLVRFLYNNKKLDRGPAGAILKEASRRSKLAKDLGLLTK